MQSGLSDNGGGGRRNTIGIASIVATLSVVVAAASWRIAAKAGYPPRLGLLAIVSPVNVILLLAFALREWPVERELRESRARLAQSARSA